jgi:hypothetical protein
MSSNRSLISELSATNQPYHWVFQILDITAGFITLACASYVWHLAGKTSPQKRWLLTSLFVCVGADSIIDASLPIACAPSMNAQCSLLATHSALTAAHLIESNIAGLIIAVAPIIWWWMHRNGEHRPIARVSLWLITLETSVGIAALIVRIANHGNYGGIQRIYQLGIGLWISLLIYTALSMQADARITSKLVETDDVPAVS